MNEKMNTLKLWVVDDEPGMCIGARRALTDHLLLLDDLGESVVFDVHTMESAEAFLEEYKDDRPHILLLDIKLPGMEGTELLERLFEEKSPVLTVMITAYASLEKAVKATKLGAYDFLAKPFTPNELRHTVRKAARNVILTEKAKRLAQEKRQIRFEFISILAHELKSPLNAIEGYTDLLKSRDAGSDIASYEEMIERIDTRIGGMRKLISDLLDLTSIESGKKKRELEPVALSDIARRVVDSNADLSAEKQVALRLDIDGAIVLIADRGEMEMLLNNLITNAIKYNRTGGSVDIHIARQDERIVIGVRDTGIGMTTEEQKRLFKEFSRIKNEKTRNIQGSGLGLSIMRKIATLYGGEIQVESEPDVGSSFTVLFPINEDLTRGGIHGIEKESSSC